MNEIHYLKSLLKKLCPKNTQSHDLKFQLQEIAADLFFKPFPLSSKNFSSEEAISTLTGFQSC